MCLILVKFVYYTYVYSMGTLYGIKCKQFYFRSLMFGIFLECQRMYYDILGSSFVYLSKYSKNSIVPCTYLIYIRK